MKSTLVLALAACICFPALAQQTEARVLRPAWDSLSDTERETVRSNHVVIVADPSDFGLIVDAQGVDQSTPGSNTGSVIGSAVGSVGYLNHALKDGNSYSPGKHLAFGLLGVLIGAAANSAPESRFQFRYALRMSDGEIVTRDVVQSEPFRHSAGMCLSLTTVSPVSKAMCGQTADEIRAKYLATNPAPASQDVAVTTADLPAQKAQQAATATSAQADEGKITCKLKDQAPVLAARNQCELLGGLIQ